jgi:phage shock protein A
MTAKANDVLELGRARALLGCSSSMTLLDGIRAVKSELTNARDHRAAEHVLRVQIERERAQAVREVERLRAEVEQLRGRSDEERGEP